MEEVSVVKNSDKERYVYSGYGIKVDSAGSWSFDNDITRNIITFGANKSSSSHDNRKNNILVLGECQTFEINGRFGLSEKKLVIILVKETQNFVKIAL